MRERQKMIRMADRSEFGWMVVNEYETDELADDEEDERRIAKALKAAEKKAEVLALKKKKQRGRASSYSSGYGSRAVGQLGRELSSRQQLPYYRTPGPSQQMPMLPARTGPGSRIFGPCFACNEYGHLRSNCPKEVGSR